MFQFSRKQDDLLHHGVTKGLEVEVQKTFGLLLEKLVMYFKMKKVKVQKVSLKLI